MREEVVEPEVRSIGIDRRNTVARVGTAAKRLLPAKNRLQSASKCISVCNSGQMELRFHPITLGVLAMRILRAKFDESVRRFPPEIQTGKVFVLILQPAIVRGADLQARLGKIKFCPAARRTLFIELIIRAGGGVVARIINRDPVRRKGG